jgi:hypothetical protein
LVTSLHQPKRSRVELGAFWAGDSLYKHKKKKNKIYNESSQFYTKVFYTKKKQHIFRNVIMRKMQAFSTGIYSKQNDFSFLFQLGMSFGVRISESSDHDSVSGADFLIRMFV